jgi:hypothetical protein
VDPTWFGALIAAFLYSTSRSLEVMTTFVGSPLSLGDDLVRDRHTIDEADVALLNIEGPIMSSDDIIKRIRSLEKKKTFELWSCVSTALAGPWLLRKRSIRL